MAGKADEKTTPQPSRGEWLAGIAGSLLVLSALGYLFYNALTDPELPPLITVEAVNIVSTPTGYLVEIGVHNEGTSTAIQVGVEGSLMRDTVTVEQSTATIAFVPSETVRRAGLYFTRDPRQYRLELRPTGFDRP